MRNFQASELVLSLRKLLTELETEHPDLDAHQLMMVVADALPELEAGTAVGMTPDTAMQFALAVNPRLPSAALD